MNILELTVCVLLMPYGVYAMEDSNPLSEEVLEEGNMHTIVEFEAGMVQRYQMDHEELVPLSSPDNMIQYPPQHYSPFPKRFVWKHQSTAGFDQSQKENPKKSPYICVCKKNTQESCGKVFHECDKLLMHIREHIKATEEFYPSSLAHENNAPQSISTSYSIITESMPLNSPLQCPKINCMYKSNIFLPFFAHLKEHLMVYCTECRIELGFNEYDTHLPTHAKYSFFDALEFRSYRNVAKLLESHTDGSYDHIKKEAVMVHLMKLAKVINPIEKNS